MGSVHRRMVNVPPMLSARAARVRLLASAAQVRRWRTARAALPRASVLRTSARKASAALRRLALAAREEMALSHPARVASETTQQVAAPRRVGRPLTRPGSAPRHVLAIRISRRSLLVAALTR